MGKTNFDLLVANNLPNQVVSVNTTGSIATNIFGTTNGFAGTITSILTSSLDDRNGIVEVYSNVGTIARITTKGSIGAVKGTALTNTAFTADGTLKAVIVPPGAGALGNVAVIATYTTA